MISLGQIAAGLMLPVFPCNDRKRPIVEGGFYSATDDASAVQAAFDKPHASMIGVPTGGRSGLVVLDVDIKHGRSGMAWLEANSERLPATRTHRTQSGGLHLLFRWPGVPIRNSASSIADGIDVRGDGGYIIYPGSPGYAVADDSPVAAMPPWLLDLVAPQQPQRVAQPPQPLRMDGGTSYGRKALEDECNGVRNAGWGSQEHTLNSAGLKIGALIAGGELDAGPATAELLAAGRSMASQPGQQPWTARDIEDKVRRAIRDGQTVPRSAPPKTEPYRPEPPMPPDDASYWASVEADAAMSAEDWHDLEQREGGASIPASADARKAAGPDLLWSVTEPWAETDIPMRPWIAPGYLMRGAVTVVSGPGSAGKSSLMVAWANVIAIGCAFGKFKVRSPLRVATYNVEDDADEQKRRFSAMHRRLGVAPEAWQGRLAILGPHRVGTLLTTARDGSLLVNTPVMDRLEAFIAEFRPDVLMLDPFVELHAAEENDNTAIRAVMARFRTMAIEYQCSVVILHHARKGAGTPGDPDSMRGASSIVGAARVALTLNVMTEEDAEALGVPKDARRNYFRLDGAKSNYAPIDDAEWFERIEYQLANGDGVAAVQPWRAPSLAPATDVIAYALRGIADGSPDGPWSPRLSDEPRSFRHLAMRLGVDTPGAQKALINELRNRQGVTVTRFKIGRRSADNLPSGMRTAEGLPAADWVDEA